MNEWLLKGGGRGWRRYIPLLLVFSLIILVYFGDFFFKGYVLDANHDRIEEIVPFHTLWQRSFQQHHLPQWNPYIFCGNTFMGGSILGALYPPNWLAYSFPEQALPFMLTVLVIAHLVLIACAAFLFFSYLFNDDYWALVASVAYALSTSVVQNMIWGADQIANFVYFPLWLYLIASYRKRPAGANVFLQAATVSLLLLGMLQMSLYMVGFGIVFAVYVSFVELGATEQRGGARFDHRPLILTGVGLLSAGALTAIRLVPFYATIQHSSNGQLPYEGLLFTCRTSIDNLLRFFTPEFFGTNLHVEEQFRRMFYGSLNHGESFTCYISVAGAFLSLYAFFFIWNRRTFFWKIMAAAVILTVVGSPLTRLYYHATMQAYLFFSRLAWLLPICTAALLGYAGKSLSEKAGRGQRFVIFTLAVFSLVLIALFVVYRQYPDVGRQENGLLMMQSIVYFSFFSALVVGIFSLWAQKGGHPVLRYLLLAAVAADLVMVGRFVEANNSRPFLSAPPLYRFSGFDRQVLTDFNNSGRNFRVCAKSEHTKFSKSIVAGFYNVSGYDNTISQYISLLYNYPVPSERQRDRIAEPLSVRGMQLASGRFGLFDDKVVEIPASLPRVSLFYNYIVEADPRTAVTLLNEGQVDYLTTVVLAEPPDRAPGAVDPAASVRLLDRGTDRVEVQTASSSDSLLLLTDSYYPGWKVAIDGKETRIIRANVAFRAVAVAAGQHRVSFYFIHPGFSAGRLITCVSFLLALVLGTVYVCLRNRTSTKVSLPSAGENSQ